MALVGSRRVEIAGMGNKRQLTAVFAGTLDGHYLSIQLMYGGKTNQCHPKGVNFPDDWHITHTHNHWADKESMNEYVRAHCSAICSKD